MQLISCLQNTIYTTFLHCSKQVYHFLGSSKAKRAVTGNSIYNFELNVD